MERFAVFDIEARDWKTYLVGGYYDGQTYEDFEDIEDLVKFCFLSCNPASVIYAHFGGIFDFIHLFDFLFRWDTEVEIKNIIMTGSKLLKFDVSVGKRSISFIDSSGLFPFSLEKLTKSFHVEHQKLDHDVSNLTEVTPELRKYLKHDCMGLYECLEKFFSEEYVRDVLPQLTRSGISFAVYKKFFNDKLPKIESAVKTFSRKAYFGGRVEIFRPVFSSSGPEDKLYYQDINSLYPSVMHDFDYPGEFLAWTFEFSAEHFGIYHATVDCPSSINIPILGIPHEGKYIFPTGRFEGFFTSAEIKFALQRGYKLVSVTRGALFQNAGPIFREFVAHFYGLRKATKDPVKKIIYKDIMNHLYGRLAINELRDQIELSPSVGSRIVSTFKMEDYEIRLYGKEKFIHTYSNPALSAFVTSYGRIRLYEFFEKAGMETVYYCDTDSIFSTTLLESEEGALGQMKLEDTLSAACFLLPKTYAYQNDLGEIVRKMKGFHPKSIEHIDLRDFVESVSGEIRIAPVEQKGGLSRFRTGLKKNDLLTVLPAKTKQLRKSYDKRIVFKKGAEYFTRPIHLEHQGSLI